MLLLPEVRPPARATSHEEREAFNRIIWWLKDCKAKMGEGGTEVWNTNNDKQMEPAEDGHS